MLGFPGGSVDKESACSTGDLGLIPGLGRSPGGENGNPLQYSWVSLVAQVKLSACNVGNLDSIPGLGRSPGDRKGYPLQYSGLQNSIDWFPGGSDGKASACNAGDSGLIPGSGRSPGKGNGNPLKYLAWRIPWTQEPARLQSMRSQKVRHD